MRVGRGRPRVVQKRASKSKAPSKTSLARPAHRRGFIPVALGAPGEAFLGCAAAHAGCTQQEQGAAQGRLAARQGRQPALRTSRLRVLQQNLEGRPVEVHDDAFYPQAAVRQAEGLLTTGALSRA